MRIGLTQRVEVIADGDERRDCLDQAWARLVVQAGFVPVPLPNQVTLAGALVNELGLGGIILTGGNDLADLPGATNIAPERDAFERRLLGICTQRQLPVLGVCRGMQMLVRFYGGTLTRVTEHVRRPHAVNSGTSQMPTLPRSQVNSYHVFGTRPELLDGELLVAGMAPDGSVEAVTHRSLPQWAVMWHPERTRHADDLPDGQDVALLRSLFGGHIR
jgi:putative glutamine amidotransferase